MFRILMFRRGLSSAKTGVMSRVPEVQSKLEGHVYRDTMNAFFVLGQGVLTETPEGYEPEVHEYFKSPITRWFSKHFYLSQEQIYETRLHAQYVRMMIGRMKKLEIKVKRLMKERQDYKAWYYTPSPSIEILTKAEFGTKPQQAYPARIGDVFKDQSK